MLIAGAGGHARELLDILFAEGKTENLYFYDDITGITSLHGFPILNSEEAAKEYLINNPDFILGTGNPQVRKMFYSKFIQWGGKHKSIKGQGIACSKFTNCKEADIFNLCFIGANTQIGKGCLINTGAQIHHDVKVGAFSEINPGAVLLGASEVGDKCSIGANATILPKVKIGNQVIVGAGSVVTKDVSDGVTVVGVPGRVILVK
ncbi:acetyltransferase [Algoriphagus halophytocola]|uniref:Acetyltransferase n=1 Tax=Algoriphagus halophytocola TaxID=2991499 RepID=A0ABY6MJI0_9BACT|nr:acetyltransferase [Algoriphagus sp. TR-M5]UZD23942.1 acetyltransferase [Algoriphagus sp. TR-M5]